MEVFKIRSERPNAAIKKAASAISRGGIVVFPTETVYGIGGSAFDALAAKKIFKIKGRSDKKPLLVLIADKHDIKRVARHAPKTARKLIEKFWPGPLTIVLKKRKVIPSAVSGGTDTIAVRLSPHPVVRALVRAAGVPITAPSANISGRPPHRTIQGVIKEFGNKKEIELFLDGGRTPIGKPSTVVDCTKNPPQIIRAGAITKKRLQKIIPTIK